jgi:putative Mg2+ transporter-C (MgtC) family protein
VLARLALAVVLGGAVGVERELTDQAAGLRTHALLTLGACLFTLVSGYGFDRGADANRIASQIVTGIGFLSGGAILRQGLNVRGLTTAASIWATTGPWGRRRGRHLRPGRRGDRADPSHTGPAPGP